MNPLSADEFGKALHSESGLTVSPTAIGFVRKTTDPHIIEFSHAAALCLVWIKIPLKMIDKVQLLGKFPCLDHVHDFVVIFFKKPESPEAAVFAELLHHEATGRTSALPTGTYQPTFDMPAPALDVLDATAAVANVRCVIVRIFSFVSGQLIHQERVTDPDIANKVRKVLQAWGAKPFGQNWSSISNC
ncbi:MAG TPA: hypothetical protein VH575_03185 [Gemmataceae bacterium]|jgi:hypothetical protein